MSTHRSPAKTTSDTLRQIFVVSSLLLGFGAYAGCSSDAGKSDVSRGVPIQAAGTPGSGDPNVTGGSTALGVGAAQTPCASGNCGTGGAPVGTKVPDACDADTCRTPCMARGVSCIDDTDCCSAVCGADGTCEPAGGRWRRARRRGLYSSW